MNYYLLFHYSWCMSKTNIFQITRACSEIESVLLKQEVLNDCQNSTLFGNQHISKTLFYYFNEPFKYFLSSLLLIVLASPPTEKLVSWGHRQPFYLYVLFWEGVMEQCHMEEKGACQRVKWPIFRNFKSSFAYWPVFQGLFDHSWWKTWNVS